MVAFGKKLKEREIQKWKGRLKLLCLQCQCYHLGFYKGEAYEGEKVWRAKDIGIKHKVCKWMDLSFVAVNTYLGAGHTLLRSLYSQYDKWGVDFVKNDCVFGDDFDMDDISYVSELLTEFDRPIIYYLSPGTNAIPELANKINGLVTTYRVTSDD